MPRLGPTGHPEAGKVGLSVSANRATDMRSAGRGQVWRMSIRTTSDNGGRLLQNGPPPKREGRRDASMASHP